MTDVPKPKELIDFSAYEHLPPKPKELIDFFAYEHLPPRLQEVSKPVGDLAREMHRTLPNSAEKTAGLRKLLEAKDCFVRAMLTLVVAVTLLLAGCATPAEAYVKADRATFRAIAPDLFAYLRADGALPLTDKQLAAATLMTWDERIAMEERRLKLPVPAPFPTGADLAGLEAAGIKRLAGSSDPRGPESPAEPSPDSHGPKAPAEPSPDGRGQGEGSPAPEPTPGASK